jgi:hypothetical protein
MQTSVYVVRTLYSSAKGVIFFLDSYASVVKDTVVT